MILIMSHNHSDKPKNLMKKKKKITNLAMFNGSTCCEQWQRNRFDVTIAILYKVIYATRF